MHGLDAQHVARLAAYEAVSTRLSLMDDRQLERAVVAATPLGSGIGGRSGEIDVAGVRVFVKRVPLTDVELRPENTRSTANLFDLPAFYHYGAGSTGFGAWRELAVHGMTTGWVLENEHDGFPLMYHWRVLPDSSPEGFADEFGGVDGAVAYWEGSPAVRERLEALGRSSSSLVLFLEHVPRTLAEWLEDEARSGGSASSYPWVEEALVRGSTFMSSRGLVHFDAHFNNILTDGRLLYFADFGLALSSGFALSAAEEEFLADHHAYDRCFTTSQLLRHHLPDDVLGSAGRAAFLRRWIAGRRPDVVPSEIATVIDRHCRAAVVLDEFHRRLLTESRRTTYPAAEIGRALRRS